MVNAYIITINNEINFVFNTYAGYKISSISKGRITLPRFASKREVQEYLTAPTREAVIFSPTEWEETQHLPFIDGGLNATFYSGILRVKFSVWNGEYGGSTEFSIKIKGGKVTSFKDEGDHSTNYVWDELPDIKINMSSKDTYRSLMEWWEYVSKYACIKYWY